MTLAAAMAVSAPALAADAPPDPRDATTLGTVAVREVIDPYLASPKFTQPLLDTPQTLQVIDQALFHQQGATTLTEALRNSAGVGTFYAGENGNTTTGDAVYMRGFDTSGSIFADGIRDLGAISRDLFNTGSIEVQKGPAGTDNGRGAPTGAINTVTKQAFLEDALSATASAGVDGQKRVAADWNQTIAGLPGGALRLNAMWQDSAVPGRDHVRNGRWGIAPALGLGLDGISRAYIDLLYVKQDNIPDGFVPTIGLPRWSPQIGLELLAGHPVDTENFYGTRDDHDDATARMATLRLEHDFSARLALTNTVRWGLTKQDYLLTSFTVTGGTDANPMAGNVKWTDPDDLATYTLNRSNNNFRDQSNRILTDQLNLRVDFTTGEVAHNLSAGVELAREEQVTHAIVASGTRPPANLYRPDWNDAGDFSWSRNGAAAEGVTTTAALYAFDTLKFGPRFLVTAGLRADRYRTTYESTAACNDGTGNNAVPCAGQPLGTVVAVNDLRSTDTLVNWKLGGVYKPVPSLSLYANLALSQQPPGGANFQLSSAANNANNPDLDPQKARTAEIGGKWSALRDSLVLNLALYQTRVSNEIVPDPVTPGAYAQNGEKKVSGVEFSMVGNLTPDWSVSAGYSHQDARVVEGPDVAQDGSRNLTYTPGDSLTTWTSYRLPMGFTVGGGWRFVDGLHRGTDGAVGTPVSTGGYGVIDAVVSHDAGERLTVRLNAYNIANREYVAAINKSGYRYSPGAPRSFLLSADYRFR